MVFYFSLLSYMENEISPALFSRHKLFSVSFSNNHSTVSNRNYYMMISPKCLSKAMIVIIQMVSRCCFATADTNSQQHLEPQAYLYIVTSLKENSGYQGNLCFPCVYQRSGGNRSRRNKSLLSVIFLPNNILVAFHNILFLT